MEINIWYLIAVVLLTALAGVLSGFFLLSKPLSILKRRAGWDRPPKIPATIQKTFEKDLERFFRNLPYMNFESRLLILRGVFGKDCQIVIGIDSKGELWIDGCSSYPYHLQASGEV